MKKKLRIHRKKNLKGNKNIPNSKIKYLEFHLEMPNFNLISNVFIFQCDKIKVMVYAFAFIHTIDKALHNFSTCQIFDEKFHSIHLISHLMITHYFLSYTKIVHS